ncbi:hypothetical protein [Micromonospora sp. IBHARD004]|uniref:hypothetical protein n=1 Tax=Micromonospora sp. IBHARD004 TaxID=3457764 RepID=UPI00405923C1
MLSTDKTTPPQQVKTDLLLEYKDYVTRRIAEGKTKTEIMRCLKRYVARETFRLLASEPMGQASLPDATATD